MPSRACRKCAGSQLQLLLRAPALADVAEQVEHGRSALPVMGITAHLDPARRFAIAQAKLTRGTP